MEDTGMGTGVAGMIIKLAQGLPAALTAPAPDSAAVDAAASSSLAARRASFLVLVVATTAGMLWLMVGALPARSSGALNAVVLFLFAMTLPWIAIGFWNSLIGFLLLIGFTLWEETLRAIRPIKMGHRSGTNNRYRKYTPARCR
jgi:membrane glycosyltransferase